MFYFFVVVVICVWVRMSTRSKRERERRRGKKKRWSITLPLLMPLAIRVLKKRCLLFFFRHFYLGCWKEQKKEDACLHECLLSVIWWKNHFCSARFFLLLVHLLVCVCKGSCRHVFFFLTLWLRTLLFVVFVCIRLSLISFLAPQPSVDIWLSSSLSVCIEERREPLAFSPLASIYISPAFFFRRGGGASSACRKKRRMKRGRVREFWFHCRT